MTTYYIPGIDPVIDVIATVGLFIGVAAGIYVREIKQYPAEYWVPFMLTAIVFALLGAEGGALDVFAPGVVRMIAMIALIVAEIVGISSALKMPELDTQ